ncbi:MAG: VOC family protein [Candidatus Magasanikiibacteriota bacterium]
MSKNTPYDPCGHTKLSVSDYKKSYSFYQDIFNELGYTKISNRKDHASWASPDGYGILIAQAKITNYQYLFDAPGLHHICFKAKTTKMVDKIYELLCKKNVFIFDTPKKYPEYTDKYYALYFADPDGIKLEIAYY